jgi:hypothetical protein
MEPEGFGILNFIYTTRKLCSGSELFHTATLSAKRVMGTIRPRYLDFIIPTNERSRKATIMKNVPSMFYGLDK